MSFPLQFHWTSPRGTTSFSRDQKARRRIEEAARTGATELDLSRLGLTELPDSVGQLQNLQELDARGNELSALPESLGQLQNLQELSVSGNRLTALPESLGQLQNLQSLDARRNKLTALPESLGQLQNLRTLSAWGNQLTALPESLGQLQNLQQLDLSFNRLTALPEFLSQLQNLETLEIQKNQLTALPESLGQLQKLRRFVLDDNPFKTVPPVYFQLRALEYIDLDRTGIVRLPGDVKNLQKVTEIYVRGNQLRALPPELGDLPKLEDLNLEGNALPDPYPEFIERGTDAVLIYLRSLAQEEETEPQYEAKLILVGEGSVGKTCLVRALQARPGTEKQAFDPKSKTTHGIKIGPVVLPHPDLPGTDITLNAWDFGGQEVYRISHQFFFSRRSLYLLVWRPREGQEAGQLEFWLKSIRLRSPDAKVILVSTYADEGRRPLIASSVLRDYGDMIVARHEVSNARGTGFQQLRETTALYAAKLPQMGEELNQRWIALRDEALAKKQPHIARSTFDRAARKNRLDKDETRVLLDLLHDLGRIVYYGAYEGLRDVVVIKPEWLTRAISFVLEDQTTVDEGGVLDHSRVTSVWRNPERPRSHQYSPKHHPFFLRLMEKFDISYRVPGKEASLIGQMVPDERPDLPWEVGALVAENSRELSLRCEMNEDPPGLVEWLIVRNHPYSTGNHWREGMFLRHLNQEALLEKDGEELSIRVRGDYPSHFFELLRGGLQLLIKDRWSALDYDLLVPCRGVRKNGSACTYDFLIEDLETALKEGNAEIPCPRCRTHQNALTLLHGFEMAQRPVGELLAQVASDVGQIKQRQAEVAELVRAIRRSEAAENKEHPSLFTLIPSAGGIIHEKWELTLWCQHPGHEHAVEKATYDVPEPKEWVARLAPAIKLLGQVLRLAVGAADLSGLANSVVDLTKKQADGMQKILKELPADDRLLGKDMRDEGGRLTPAQGAAFRQLRSLLREIHPAESWGGLRRFPTNAGDWLWICPVHSKLQQYDPGYPVLPEQQPEGHSTGLRGS